ncbi:MAG: DUF4175 family protein [Cyclobacteriaceae bacterium]|nr:DUF4175 family protein [Cyclobacteriaceae bacterium]
MFIKNRQISDEYAAQQIGGFFPEIKDKLLNIIQLKKQINQNNSLILAGIEQKSSQIQHLKFDDAINFQDGFRYIKYLLVPFMVISVVSIVAPGMLTESPVRIIQYHKEFVPEAPFQFRIKNESLTAFKNEDFSLNLELEGTVLPDNVYLKSGGRKLKLQKADIGIFTYDFQKIQNSLSFYFEAGGYQSANFTINVVNRPNVKNFDVIIDYPAYLGKDSERLNNVGNFMVPEGSKAKWMFNTIEADEMKVSFYPEDEEVALKKSANQLFEFEKQLFQSTEYKLDLKNQYSGSKDIIRYEIEVITDQYPQISVDQYQDTTLFNLMVLGGKISDDYGFSDLKVFYRLIRGDEEKGNQDYENFEIPIRKGESSQSFYQQWFLNEFKLRSGDNIEYYLQVRDNDGINGRKATKTPTYTFRVPSRKEVEESISQATQNTENQIDKTVDKAREINEKIQQIEDRLKGKKDITWQDEKMMRDLLEQKRELERDLGELREKFNEGNKKRERFQENENQQMIDKVAQLQKLMDELLDDETKKLYEELQKLLEENAEPDKLRDMMNKLNNKESNLEKELERTLELFKRMKYEMKLEEVAEQAKKLQEEQQSLAEQSNDKNADTEKLLEEQQQLNEELKDTEKKIDELQKLNQDLKRPNPAQDFSEDVNSIKKEQEGAIEDLEKGKQKPAGQKQQNAADKLKELADKLEQMQSSVEMTMMQENMNDLRMILNNLIKLSFDQEELMVDFRNVNLTDPRFVTLSQQQLKIKDDAKIVEDSLRSLAERAFQIQSFVTREVNDMNQHMDEAMTAIRDRKKNVASGKQQFVMTSMNNLALLLDDVLTQMQQAMADAMGKPQQGKDGEMQMPSLSELQKQLGDRINEIKRGNLQGRELSEELARMAAEQERLRKMMQQLEKDLNESQEGGGAGGMDDLINKMEENEMDMVNKKITEKTIERQKEIETRLLEAENALRERELSEEREAEHARDYEQRVPDAFKEYIQQKEKEIELLRTVPPKLNPYFKQEVNEYFKRIGSL